MNKEKLRLFFDRACAVSLYILLFFIPISSAAIEIFFGFALLFFLARLFVSGGFYLQLLKNEKIVVFFFITLAFSLVNSGIFLPISLHALIFKWGRYIILYWVTAHTLISTPRIKYAIASISIGATLVILDCYSQLLFGFEFLRHRSMVLHANNILAITGPFAHNNGLAAYLICVLVIILYWIFSKSTMGIKYTAGTFFFLGIVILSRAYSRGAWISFIIAILLLAILLKKFKFLGLSLLAIIILGVRFSVLKFLILKDSGRFELWDISFRMIKDHPLLGNGIGTFMALFRNFSLSRDISYAHNCFLQIWAEAGLIAVIIFIVFIVKIVKEGLLFYKKSNDLICVILVCTIIAYLGGSFFDTHLFSLQLAVLFWVLLGLLKGSIMSGVMQQ